MSKVLRYGKGRGTIEIEGTQRELILGTIRAADPSIVKVLEDTTEQLAKKSQDRWLVRQPKYGRSQDSKGQHKTGLRIIPPYTIEAFVENTANYAWAIKVGPDSTTNIRQGRRLAAVVLWDPARRGVQKVVEAIAKETVKRLRKI
mgnify:CR=1 FL=1|tara:strand:- start:348 stop:782 length:435 start_codon:yes stop_codon:yes gene_type:complete